MRFLLIAIFLALPVTATAAMCGPHDVVVDGMKQRYGETLRAQGTVPGGMMELLASSDTGSWTLVFTDMNGVSCLRAAGTGIQMIEPLVGDGA